VARSCGDTARTGGERSSSRQHSRRREASAQGRDRWPPVSPENSAGPQGAFGPRTLPTPVPRGRCGVQAWSSRQSKRLFGGVLLAAVWSAGCVLLGEYRARRWLTESEIVTCDRCGKRLDAGDQGNTILHEGCTDGYLAARHEARVEARAALRDIRERGLAAALREAGRQHPPLDGGVAAVGPELSPAPTPRSHSTPNEDEPSTGGLRGGSRSTGTAPRRS